MVSLKILCLAVFVAVATAIVPPAVIGKAALDVGKAAIIPAAIGAIAAGPAALGAAALGAKALGPAALGASILGPAALGAKALGPAALGAKALGPAALGTKALGPAALAGFDFTKFFRIVPKIAKALPWWPAWKAKAAKTGVPHVFKPNDLPLAPLGVLAKAVTKGAGPKTGVILLGLSKIAFPKSIEKAILTLVGLSKALGAIINVVVPGIGVIIASIAIAAGKILLCVNGIGKLQITGFAGVCKSDYGKEYGCKPIPDDDCKSPSDIIDHYKLGDIEDQIEKLIHKATNGKGVTILHKSIQIIVKHIKKEIAPLFKHGANHNWVLKDIEKVTTALATILGVIGNSYSCTDGYGSDLVESIIDYLTPAFTICGLDIKSHEKDIKDSIDGCGRYQFGGALKNCKDNDDNNNDDCDDDSKGDEDKGDDHQGDGNKGDDHKGDDHKGDDHKGDDHKGDDHKGNDDCDDDNKGNDDKHNDDNKDNDNKDPDCDD